MGGHGCRCCHGVDEGTGKGNNGEIKVEVTVEGGNIVSVVLKEHSETQGIDQAAEKGTISSFFVCCQSCSSMLYYVYRSDRSACSLR